MGRMTTVSTTFFNALTALVLLVSSASALAQAPVSAVVTTPQVRAELMAHAPQGVQPGAPLWLGLQLQHQPGWHTYWRNPGDSGLATQLSWQLPAGMQAGGILWPLPQMITVGDMVNHGFENTVLLAEPVQISKTFKPGTTEVRLQADWLICKQECIPQSGQFVLKLPAATSIADHGMAFEQLLSTQALALSPSTQTAQLNAQGLALQIRGLPAAINGHGLKVFADSPEVLASGLGLNGGGSWQDGVWQMNAPVHRMRSTEPKQLGLLLVDDSQTPAAAWQLKLDIQGKWPEAAPLPVAAEVAQTVAAPAPSVSGLLGAMLGAVLGGLLLNLMPCVLPVLAIKVLSLSKASISAAQRRGIGSAYAAGVLLSMLALALLVMGLRAAGSQLGWGFQLQSPWLVAALALLFTLIGLNLFGVIEMRGNWTSGLAAQMARHPLMDAFLSGVLAVVVAAPCTAPFMGASVGIAFTLPIWQGLLIFLCLGSGLALPFTLSAWVPATARWLPRPGAWMVVLRQALAFPMLLTVVWLLWVFAKQTSSDAASVLLAALALISGFTWSLGLTDRSALWVRAAFVSALCGLLWLAQPVMRQFSAADSATSVSDAQWQAWSEERVGKALQAGQPVFIDFTAAWCVTCQVNKQTTLRDAQVLQAFADKHVLLLQADWTRRDPAISRALTALGRSGVPVYVLQAPGKPAQVLSELLTPDLVLNALADLR
jgi:thiol:disulfide interchange protein/DsbC/DsbD-like thiol-disulfide interchange protein